MKNKKKYIELANEYAKYKLPKDYFKKDYNELKKLNRAALETVVDEAIVYKAQFSYFQYEFLKLQLDKLINEDVSKNIKSFAEMSNAKLQLIDSQIFYPSKNLLSDLIEKEAIDRETKIVKESKKRDLRYLLYGVLISSVLTIPFGYFVNLTTPSINKIWPKNTNEPLQIQVMDLPIIKNNTELKQ